MKHAAPPDTLPLDAHLCFSLYSASLAIGRLYKPMLDALGITYPQYLVLTALSEAGELTISGIAGRLALESSTITPLVKRLQAAGLVTRVRSSADERQVDVQLTDAGRTLLGKTPCLAEALFSGSGMSIEAIRRLNDEARALRDALAERIAG